MVTIFCITTAVILAKQWTITNDPAKNRINIKGNGGGWIQSINGDKTPAHIINGANGLTVTTANGTTTIDGGTITTINNNLTINGDLNVVNINASGTITTNGLVVNGSAIFNGPVQFNAPITNGKGLAHEFFQSCNLPNNAPAGGYCLISNHPLPSGINMGDSNYSVACSSATDTGTIYIISLQGKTATTVNFQFATVFGITGTPHAQIECIYMHN